MDMRHLRLNLVFKNILTWGKYLRFRLLQQNLYVIDNFVFICFRHLNDKIFFVTIIDHVIIFMVHSVRFVVSSILSIESFSLVSISMNEYCMYMSVLMYSYFQFPCHFNLFVTCALIFCFCLVLFL